MYNLKNYYSDGNFLSKFLCTMTQDPSKDMLSHYYQLNRNKIWFRISKKEFVFKRRISKVYLQKINIQRLLMWAHLYRLVDGQEFTNATQSVTLTKKSKSDTIYAKVCVNVVQGVRLQATLISV